MMSTVEMITFAVVKNNTENGGLTNSGGSSSTGSSSKV